ncbi:MAG: hypothetical protein WCT99_05925 [Bacteroidota bacterium]|jgi:anti-sigma28 factor (negative regulator of flagellin synthesis)
MDIRKIAQAQVVHDPLRVRQEKEKHDEQNHSTDSVELSPEALERFQEVENKKIETIQQRIASGFYFTPDVTQKVADELLKRFGQ